MATSCVDLRPWLGLRGWFGPRVGTQHSQSQGLQGRQQILEGSLDWRGVKAKYHTNDVR